MEIILAIIAACAVMKQTIRFFYTDTDDLLDCLKYWFQPSPSRFFSNGWDGEFWRELRLFIWISLGSLSGYGVYYFLTS